MSVTPPSFYRTQLLLIVFFSLFVPAVLSAPIADFTGSPASGCLPLTVQFTDDSSGTPTGWAWFFGDENYTQPWEEQAATAEWPARYLHTSLVMPDGSIILFGGGYGDHDPMNDVWRSSDYGSSWTLINSTPGWSARFGHTSVVMPDGSIILMGGYDGSTAINDVWVSTDYGSTWSLQNGNPGWSPRYYHTSVVMPDGSIILMGGYDGTNKNDVWKSTDNGATWVRVIETAEWSPRFVSGSGVMPDGSIILIGGNDGVNKNDVWKSTDSGASWTLTNPNAEWSDRYVYSAVVMPDGSIFLMGGKRGSSTYLNDVWRSNDYGVSWARVNNSAGWSGRYIHSGVVTPDGSIIITGGYDGSIPKNDVWRFNPSGSSVKNPSHTFTTPGIYNVTLQSYNAFGYNSTRKTGYIRVSTSSPVVSFSANITAGKAPLSVQFNDTSTNFSLNTWNWSFGDNSTSTIQNPVHVYTTPGNFTISLTAAGGDGSNTSIKSDYITVAALNPPVAAFSANATNGKVPLAVQFTDSSLNSPTSWNWSFGDNSTSATQNPVHVYTAPGNFTVSLSVLNSDGANSTVKHYFIHVTPMIGNFTITLRSGWNFVSTPRSLISGKNTALIFNDVNTMGHSIWQYDANSKQWIVMRPTTKVNALDGIWIYSNTTVDVPLWFNQDPLRTPPTKQVYTGWNAIGFSDITPLSAKSTLMSVDWAQTIGYDAEAQGYELSIITGDTGVHTDSRVLLPTKGYWLYITQNGDLAAVST